MKKPLREKGNEKENKVKEKRSSVKKPLHDPRIRKTLLYRKRINLKSFTWPKNQKNVQIGVFTCPGTLPVLDLMFHSIDDWVRDNKH